MVLLTTHQRDLLKLLLTAEGALGAAALGQQLGLSTRQVHYNLRAVESWLARRQSGLQKQPGRGIAISGSPAQRNALLDEFVSLNDFQLVLTAGQRQQLLALALLLAGEPHTLYQLQRDLDVSRTTILKDLDHLDAWFATFNLIVERRPNYGCRLEGAEWQQRQALAALLWGGAPFDDPLFKMTHARGLLFALAEDAELLPIVGHTNSFVQLCDTHSTLEQVIRAEAELEGQFTDEALLLVTLALAIQKQRLDGGREIKMADERVTWLKEQNIWAVAVKVGTRLWPGHLTPTPPTEVAAIALQLLAGARETQWASGMALDQSFHSLVDDLLARIATAYQMDELKQDATLRNGLAAQIVPAVMRKRFGIWAPSAAAGEGLTASYTFERELAQKLATVIAAHTGVILSDSELHDLIFLLRAAFIRERPTQPQRILVVCPTGMAMSQLLLARLKARFPHVGTFEPCSLRELNDETVTSADLIITTVPLYRNVPDTVHVIQVHPMLPTADIQAITDWIS